MEKNTQGIQAKIIITVFDKKGKIKIRREINCNSFHANYYNYLESLWKNAVTITKDDGTTINAHGFWDFHSVKDSTKTHQIILRAGQGLGDNNLTTIKFEGEADETSLDETNHVAVARKDFDVTESVTINSAGLFIKSYCLLQNAEFTYPMLLDSFSDINLESGDTLRIEYQIKNNYGSDLEEQLAYTYYTIFLFYRRVGYYDHAYYSYTGSYCDRILIDSEFDSKLSNIMISGERGNSFEWEGEDDYGNTYSGNSEQHDLTTFHTAEGNSYDEENTGTVTKDTNNKLCIYEVVHEFTAEETVDYVYFKIKGNYKQVTIVETGGGQGIDRIDVTDKIGIYKFLKAVNLNIGVMDGTKLHAQIKNQLS